MQALPQCIFFFLSCALKTRKALCLEQGYIPWFRASSERDDAQQAIRSAHLLSK